jgi:aerobic carbon-monoxide dehydrogenase medium subunit
MKAAAFELARPGDLAEASALLLQPGARPLAGGQSLGPMLNLRLVRPALLVQLSGIAALHGVEVTHEAVTIGACVTHAAIADGRVPDVGKGVLARVAEGIAYRAVRNRGTIGGSLCHADPAADWVTTLTALGAEALTSFSRRLPMAAFVHGAFQTALQPGELLLAVRVPRLGASARWGFAKACRKPGEFAHAMAAVLIDPARGISRAVIGATGTAPRVLDGALQPHPPGLYGVVLRRALAEASA